MTIWYLECLLKIIVNLSFYYCHNKTRFVSFIIMKY